MFKRLKTFGRYFGAMVLLVVLMTAAAWVVIPNQEAVANVANNLESYRYWLLGFRLLLLGAAWWYWDSVLSWYFGDKNPRRLAVLQSRRNFYVGFLILAELVLAQNVIGAILTWWGI